MSSLKDRMSALTGGSAVDASNLAGTKEARLPSDETSAPTADAAYDSLPLVSMG